MKKLVIFMMTAFAATTMYGQLTRNLENFVSVYSGGDVKIELIPSGVHKVEIKMLKGKDTDLITEVKGGQLKVKTRQEGWGGSATKAEVKVFYTKLEEIEAAAGSVIMAREAVKSRNLEISASSGARVTLEIACELVTAEASSGSKMSLTGTVKEKGRFEASSGAGVDASGLQTKIVMAEASSGGNLSVWATEKLDADSSSGGRINYKGNPKEKNLSNNISGGNIDRL